jgi:ribosomal RNA-processing protein 36
MRKTAKKAKTEEERDQIQAILSKEMNRVAERERWKNRREIVQSHRRKERLAIAHGQKKNPYFMKRKDLKRKELEIKFDTLKKEGRLGKYMEKRRKKNSQKDRKRMPRNFS